MEAVLLILGLLALYVVSIAVWPYTACGACQGGKHHSPTGKNHRPCGRCDGSGKKVRLGSRLIGRDPSNGD